MLRSKILVPLSRPRKLCRKRQTYIKPYLVAKRLSGHSSAPQSIYDRLLGQDESYKSPTSFLTLQNRKSSEKTHFNSKHTQIYNQRSLLLFVNAFGRFWGGLRDMLLRCFVICLHFLRTFGRFFGWFKRVVLR